MSENNRLLEIEGVISIDKLVKLIQEMEATNPNLEWEVAMTENKNLLVIEKAIK